MASQNVSAQWGTQAELYAQVEFKTDSIANNPAPHPFLAFLFGIILTVVGVVIWSFRVRSIRNILAQQGKTNYTLSIRIRCWLTAFTENDSAFFTIVRMAAQSFLQLAATQVNYRLAFQVMLAVFALEGFCVTLQIVLDLAELRESRGHLDALTITSKFLRADLKKNPKADTLKSTNVYEDMTRQPFIVGMVFFTQTTFISFVLYDVLNNDTHTCLDGSKQCPVVGTLGSYCIYIFGIFMTCVFLLGPKNDFGRGAEQDPAYWIKLFLNVQAYRPVRPTYSWYDPVEDTRPKLTVRIHSITIRYIMSFLINGVGFFWLIHSLPLQVAAQTSLTGVVIRAVGMMYLVDLDDTSGYELTMLPMEQTETGDDVEQAKDKAEVSPTNTPSGTPPPTPLLAPIALPPPADATKPNPRAPLIESAPAETADHGEAENIQLAEV